MKQWLTSVIGATLLSTLAISACPRGKVRRVLRFICAMECMLALCLPLGSLDISSWLTAGEDYRAEAERVTREQTEQSLEEQRIYIQQQYAAYILEEAAQLGLNAGECTVLVRWDSEQSTWLPAYATVAAPFQEELSRIIEEKLGIGREAQRWEG